jgi:hypothetical protein
MLVNPSLFMCGNMKKYIEEEASMPFYVMDTYTRHR